MRKRIQAIREEQGECALELDPDESAVIIIFYGMKFVKKDQKYCCNTTQLSAAVCVCVSCLVTLTATSSCVALVRTQNSWLRMVGRKLTIT